MNNLPAARKKGFALFCSITVRFLWITPLLGKQRKNKAI